jgi:epoxyqueuosine reductase
MTDTPSTLADALVASVRELAAGAESNRLPTTPDRIIFDEPLVRFAAGDDPLFEQYKTIIGDIHLTPREVLEAAFPGAELPEQVSVVSWILPITQTTRESNRAETKGPSRLWSHTRWFGEMFNDDVRRHVVRLLTDAGYLATAPMISPYFKMSGNEQGPFSNWSERHVAYAAGHGTFSLSDGFITERGIAHRCGSVVTTASLPASGRKATHHYGNCLYYADGSCGICIERCPAGAISENGHDKPRCQQYLHDLGYDPAKLKDGYDLNTSVSGCGLCQTKVPCEAANPVK